MKVYSGHGFRKGINTLIMLFTGSLLLVLLCSLSYILFPGRWDWTAHAGSYTSLGQGYLTSDRQGAKIAVSVYGCKHQVAGQSYVEILSTLYPPENTMINNVYGSYDVNYNSLNNQGKTLTELLPGYLAGNNHWYNGYSQLWQSQNLGQIPAVDRPTADISVEINGQTGDSYRLLGVPLSKIFANCH